MTQVYVIVVVLLTISQISWTSKIKSNDAEILQKQELIFQLLWHTKDTPKNHPEVFERIKNYKLEDITAACENQTYAKEFEAHLTGGMLPRGQVFSPFRNEHVDEIRTMFNVFRNAKNFDDFAAMVAWSSFVVNEITWLHAFIMALRQRPDAKYICLPNLYEILPHYFFNADVVVQAYRIKAGEVAEVTDQYTIIANYTGQFSSADQDEEYKLSYFLEDVALNEFYFQYTTSLPFWMNSHECGIQKNLRGELYYHIHKLLLNRYRLERLSLSFSEIEDIDWEQPIVTGFHPSMTHFNGLLFPTRERGAHVPVFKYSFLEKLKHYEARISKAIDLGELRSEDLRAQKMYDSAEAFNDFCNALEGNADSLNGQFYGSLDRFYRRVLGFAPESTTKRRTLLSALEMSQTSLRDPGFYRMCKRIVDYGLRFKRNLAPYKHEELSFDGVRVDYVHVEQLVTYLSAFESTLNHPRVIRFDDSVQQSCQPRVTVKARQVRLNHKPFGYTIGVSSERATKAIVRTFLGPRHDAHGNELDFLETVDEFYELDRWIVELKQGSNKLKRSSRDSVYFVPEPISSDATERLISRGLQTSYEDLAHELANRKLRQGLPARLLLPLATKAGLGLRLVVCLHPVESSRITEGLGIFERFPLDGRPLGFPLDRLIDGVSFKGLRNVVVKNVVVYHDEEAKVVDAK